MEMQGQTNLYCSTELRLHLFLRSRTAFVSLWVAAGVEAVELYWL
jgi:hypothetical protein